MNYFVAVLLVICAIEGIHSTKINIDQYLQKGYVVSIIPSSHKDSFWVDEKEKHVHVKAEFAETKPGKPTGDNYFEFIPIYEASIFPSAAPVGFNTSCFSSYSAQMTDFTETGATISVTAHGHKSLICMDSIMVASRESIHFFEFLLEGTSDAKFSWTNSDESGDIEQNGFQVFYLPDGYIKSILDIWTTYQLFAGKKTFEDGIEFMEQHMNITFVSRITPNFAPDESEIMDGDYLAIFGPSNATDSTSIGVSALISLGTGGHTSHAALCLRVDGQLYVLESNGKGVIRTPYSGWLRGRPDNMISILRLREDLQSIFNSTAAANYFKTVEGLPYGNENFIYGWIDTVNGNYPPPLDDEEVPGVLVLGDALFHKEVNLGIVEGLNNRLGTTNLSVSQILEICDQKNISVTELIAMPELDSYVYPNPTGPRMVCDVFVLNVYRVAGIFGNLVFNAAELTPKDSYQLQIFSTTWQRPEGCQNDAVPGICQISGMYWLELPGFNSISPYTHMNEKCAAVPTEYVRTPVGC